MNLRNLLAAATAAGAVLSLAGAASAQSVATETASATIIAPSSIQGTQPLAFGTIAKPTSSDNTVTVGADTSVTSPTLGSTGNGYITQNGQAHPAIFHLTGTANHTVSVSANLGFGTDDSNLGITSEAASAILPGQTSATYGQAATVTLNGSGTYDLPVGGVIDVTTNTAVKTYSGTLTVTATFN